MEYIIESDINGDDEYILENYSIPINLDIYHHNEENDDEYDEENHNYTYIIITDNEYWYDRYQFKSVIDNWDIIIMG